MIARGRFHIKLSSLVLSFIKLPFSSMIKSDKVEDVVKDFNEMFGFKVTYFMSSCRISFYTLIKSLDLPPKSEILLSPITIPDMVNAIRIAGHIPVFVDMERDTHGMCINDLEQKAGTKSKLVLLTYLSGLIPEVNQFVDYCRENDLVLVEDFSQLIGGIYKGRPLGTFGHYGVASFSIGKTATAQVGGCVVANVENKELKNLVQKNTTKTPSRYFFYRQLKENIKVEILTNPVVFNFFTGPLLKLLSLMKPKEYLCIHKVGVINRFDQNDLFFDDIPIKRECFDDALFFKFNNFMAEIFSNSLSEWKERTSKRMKNLNFLRSNLSKKNRRCLAGGLYKSDIFPVRAPFYSRTIEDDQLKLMKLGVDTGTYGLNLCHKEPVFSEYDCALPVAEEIHKNCFFISLHEKVSRKDLEQTLVALEEVLEC